MSDETDQRASEIIDAFGGIRPMAAQLNVPVSTVQGWKQRDTIPAGRMEAVRAAAEAVKIDLGLAGPAALAAESPSTSNSTQDQDMAGEEREPAPEESPNPSISAPKERAATPARGGGIAMLALAVALGVGGWVWWSTQDHGANGGDNARLSELEGRVARLAEKAGKSDPDLTDLTEDVAVLQTRLSDLASPDLESELAPLRAEIVGLRDKLATQVAGEGSAPGPALLARLDALDVEIQNAIQVASTNMQAMGGGLLDFDAKLKALAETQAKFQSSIGARIDALEAGRSADEAETSRASTLALAAGQLRTALERGAPYVGPLELLETVSADDPKLGAAVMALRAMSETGVAKGAALELSFTKLVPDLLAADRASSEGADGSLVDRLTGQINDIISVRRTGADVPGDNAEAWIARAEIFLADRDVVAAILEFNGLTGPVADILVPWLAQARGHVDARDALAVIEAEAIARLRADGGSR